MTGAKQFQLVVVIGLITLFLAVWSLLDWSKPAPNSPAETGAGEYRLMDLESRVCVGNWSSRGGRSTLTLRDGYGTPRLILQADQTEGGSISIQDANGQWHYPCSPARS
jgi:hypothetical protein